MKTLQDSIVQEICGFCFLTHFLMALFAERTFLLKKKTQWQIYLLLFPSYHFAGYDYTLDHIQLVQAVLCNVQDLCGWQWKHQNIW